MQKELAKYTLLVKFLNNALGERFRVSLIDAEDAPECTCQAPDAAGTAVSDPAGGENSEKENTLSLLLSDILQSSVLKSNDYIFSYSGQDGSGSGKKHSVFNIHADDGSLAGFLCIEETKGDLYMVKEVFDELMRPEGQEDIGSQRIASEVNSLMKDKILQVWQQYSPSEGRPKKADKVAFISELFEMGIFRVRGGARIVSEVTGISPASVYRYLGEIIEE